MNEEELADLLTQHLDTLLEGGSLPETLPPEVADLLTVAHSFAETAPKPRPEFGPALRESLLGPTGVAPLAPPSTGSVFGGHIVTMVVVGFLAGAAILALLVSIVIFSRGGSILAPTPAPVQTQTAPTQPAVVPFTPTLTVEPTSQPTETIPMPIITPTPVVDVLPVITVTIEITIAPPALVPGPSGGDGNSGGGGSGGDHNRGHGNDSDHHDEDNPGKGGDD